MADGSGRNLQLNSRNLKLGLKEFELMFCCFLMTLTLDVTIGIYMYISGTMSPGLTLKPTMDHRSANDPPTGSDCFGDRLQCPPLATSH